MKVPTIWAMGLICLVLGAAIGILAATYLEIGRPSMPNEITYLTPADATDAAGPPGGAGGGPPGGMASGKAPGGAGGGPPGGMGDGGSAKEDLGYPTVLTRLATLIRKLDALTGTPLAVSLSEDQKKAVAEQLSGLDTAASVTTDEAQKRLDALLEILAPFRDTFEAAGFAWPDPGTKKPPRVPIKLTEEVNVKALKSLQERLGGAPSP